MRPAASRRLALFVTVTLVGVLLGLQTPPLRSAPILTVREQAGQLIIAWTPLSPYVAARLEILDGAFDTTIPVYASLTGVTYARRSGDVQVRLMCGTHQNITHFVSREETTPAQLSAELGDLTAQARSLRIATERGLWRISQIQRTADQMLSATLR